MKRALMIFGLCLLMVAMPFGSVLGRGQGVNIGDYVEFGSYMGTRVLWRVMELKDGNPLLWSEYVLCAKCFDAAESGNVGEGADEVGKWGNSLWSKSNLREWLNTMGKVNWSTYPPASAAVVWGRNNYENEPGFLTGFSKAERDMLVPTERVIIGSYFHRNIETTQDLVFLATVEEVLNGGKWSLNNDSRIKFPTPTAMAKFNDMALIFKRGFGYQYFLMTPDDYYKSKVRAVDYGGDYPDEYSACHGCVGIVPAVQIANTEPKSGDGSKKNPWKF